MAEVFKAKAVGAEGFEKLVAIKRILPSVAEDEDFIRMFVDEAKITSALSHANLAQTFDLGRHRDTWYIAMEYVPGKDLRAVFERLKRRGDRMPLQLAAWVMARVCDGLDYAHRKRDPQGEELHIVHRDVSPQNVVVSFDGEVKLIDFGIARAANKMSSTQAGILKGKLGYMSPEQVRGMSLDRRSDVFSAGVVLYELCTGERLFTGTSDFAVLEKVQAARVPQPSKVEPRISAELERVILKALAREPHDRHPFAADLAADLTRYLLASQQQRVSGEDLAAFMRATFPEDSAREAGAPVATRRPEPRTTAPRARTATGPSRRSARPMSMDELAAAERFALEQQLGLHAAPSVEPASALDGDEETLPDLPELPDTGPVELRTAPRASPSRISPEPVLPGADASLPSRGRHRRAHSLHHAPDDGAKARPPEAEEHHLPEAELADPDDEAHAGLPEAELADAEDAGPAGESALELAHPLEVEAPASAAPAVPQGEPVSRRPGGPRPPPRPAARPASAPPAGAATSREDRAQGGERPPAWPRLGARLLVAAALVALAAAAAFTLNLWKKDAGKPPPLGIVTIAVEPEDAELLLDGAQLKDSLDRGATQVRLTPGVEHSIAAHREGFVDQVQRIQIALGERRDLRVVLQRPASLLVVRSTPPGAQILFDGRERGATPGVLSEVDTERAHVLALDKRCFAPFKLVLPARENRSEVSATLEPIRGPCTGQPASSGRLPGAGGAGAAAGSGFLSLASRPAAQVSIDGADIGRATPLSAWPLKPGRHTVKLSAGALSKEVPVEIRGGRTHSEIVDLTKR